MKKKFVKFKVKMKNKVLFLLFQFSLNLIFLYGIYYSDNIYVFFFFIVSCYVVYWLNEVYVFK